MNFLNKDGLSYFLVKIKELLISKADSTYVESLKQVQEITLRSGPVWSQGDPYTQSVSVSGITENDSPILDVKLSGTSELMVTQQEEWGKILKAETYNGGIKFYASEETGRDLTILVKGK